MHNPRNSSSLLLRSRCCFVGVLAVFVLVMINSVPLLELSLGTSTTQESKLAFGADGDSGPNFSTNSTARLSPSLAASDDDFEFALDVGEEAESSAHVSLAHNDFSLKDYSNERQAQVQQQTQAPEMPTAEFGTNARSPSESYSSVERAGGGGEQVISGPVNRDAIASRVGVRTTKRDFFHIDLVCLFTCTVFHVEP